MVYVDVLLVINFFMTLLLLLLTAALTKQPRRNGRLCIAAMLGAAYSLILLAPKLPTWVVVLSKIAVALVLVLAAFGFGSVKKYLRCLLCFLAANFVLLGFIVGVWLLFRPRRIVVKNSAVYFDLPARTLLLLALAAYVLALLILAVCVISLFRNRPRVHKMAQLVDQNNGSVMDITHWETSIGKSKANDVVLPLPSVSRFHAVIAKKKDGWMVTDTFSKNGVQVNGVQVDQRAPLADGDILMIGTIPLQFLCKEAISTDDRSQMRTAARQSRGQTVAYGVLVDAETHRPVYIKKQDVLIGRGEDADIQLLSPTVSTHHARLRRTSKGWAVYDLDSHNGTKLNGRFITQPQLIFDEDMLTFGDKVFLFYEK